MSIHWEESLRLGVPAIDAQHEELFAQFAKLSTAIEDGGDNENIGNLISYLNEFATTHFTDEENLMLQYNYPGLDEQRKYHAQFKKNIIALSDMLSAKVPTKEIAIKVNATLVRYFINHIRSLDSKIVDFVKQTGEGEPV